MVFEALGVAWHQDAHRLVNSLELHQVGCVLQQLRLVSTFLLTNLSCYCFELHQVGCVLKQIVERELAGQLR